MKIFDVLKKKSYSDVFAIGLKFSTNKSGFEEFAQSTWKIAHGDYLRAVVSSAVLLQTDSIEKLHDIHTLDFVYGNVTGDGNAIIHPLYLYFDDTDRTLTQAYRACLADYSELEKMYRDLQEIEFSKFAPLTKSTNFYKLMNYNNKKVLISTVKGDDKQVERGIYRIKMFGASTDSIKVRFGGQRMNLFDVDKGILSIHDPDSLEMLFQNHYVESDRYTRLQKAGFVYGAEDARKVYEDTKIELSSRRSPAVVVGERSHDYMSIM